MKKIFVLFLILAFIIPIASSKEFKELTLQDYFYKENVYIRKIGSDWVEYSGGKISRIGDIRSGKIVEYNEN